MFETRAGINRVKYGYYDIISSKGKECPEPILIEVKSSACDCALAEMTISRNEWDVAQSKCNKNKYYFYLWLLGHYNQLAVISADEVVKHIAEDIGGGKWKSVNIPFSDFTNRFQTIHIKTD